MANVAPHEIDRRVDSLKKTRIFYRLPEKDLKTIAGLLEEKKYPVDEIIFRQGADSGALYIIKSGQVEVSTEDDVQARLSRRDIFGEIGLIFDEPRTATVVTTRDTDLYILSREDLEYVQQEFPRIASALKLEAKVRQQLQKRDFPGKHPDEYIAAFEHRHPYVLMIRLLPPIIFLLLAILVDVFGLVSWGSVLYVIPNIVVQLFGILLILIGIGWVLWAYLDWANDWYIVTNKRVIHIEEIKFFFYERREIDLDKIHTTQIITPPIIGQLLDIKTLIIQTASAGGSVVFDKVLNADRVREQIDYQGDLLEEYSQELAYKEEMHQIRELLYPKLGLEIPPRSSIGPYIPEQVLRSKQRLGCLFKIMGRFYRPSHKTKEGDVVWHKHWYALVLKTWHLLIMMPISLILLAVMGYFTYAGGLNKPLLQNWGLTTTAPLTLTVFFSVVTIVLFLGFLWRYIDWQDDAYIVSRDSVTYIEDTPFGFYGVERVDVEFDNIQDISCKRSGILAQILDYGDVVIGTASKEGMVTFKYVARPVQVQMEIWRRMKLHEESIRRRQKLEQRREIIKVIKEYDVARFEPLQEKLKQWREEGYDEEEIRHKMDEWYTMLRFEPLMEQVKVWRDKGYTKEEIRRKVDAWIIANLVNIP